MAKSCNYGGGWCPKLAIEGGLGYCADHAPKQRATKMDLNKYYKADHRRNRVLAFARDGWTCQKCNWKPRIVREAERFAEVLEFPPQAQILAELTREYHRGNRHLQADHIIEVEVRPDLANDLANMQTLCSICHNDKSAKTRSAGV